MQEEAMEDTIKMQMYTTMLRIREFENRAITEYRKGNIPGFIHPSVGQEAMAAGFAPFVKKEDYFLCTHRGHGVVVAKGAKTDRMMAELFGRETGYCKGKAGSIHIAAFDLNIVGANGIVGANIPIASGVALACKLRKPGTITACFFGDGATCTGSFHEGVGFAASFNLPVVFVVSNNQFALSTSPCYHSKRMEHISDKARGYGIPGVTVDGNDVIAVGEAAQEAIKRARTGGGPTLLEGTTYRIYGHHLGDPGTGYRKEEDVEQAKKRDPIILMRERLIKEGVITEEDNARLVNEAQKEMDEAVAFALKSREPAPEDALKDVYYSI
jgi:TPP-dependent pyruvate/acetoin dehydrogenase alpha subunit